MGTSLRSFAHPTCYMLLNLTSGEIQEYPCKTHFSPLFGPFPNTAGSDSCNCQVIFQMLTALYSDRFLLRHWEPLINDPDFAG